MVGGCSEAWCFSEKRARNRTARGVASETRAARRGTIGSVSLNSGERLPESSVGVDRIFLVLGYVGKSGAVAVGAMMYDLLLQD